MNGDRVLDASRVRPPGGKARGPWRKLREVLQSYADAEGDEARVSLQVAGNMFGGFVLSVGEDVVLVELAGDPFAGQFVWIALAAIQWLGPYTILEHLVRAQKEAQRAQQFGMRVPPPPGAASS